MLTTGGSGGVASRDKGANLGHWDVKMIGPNAGNSARGCAAASWYALLSRAMSQRSRRGSGRILASGLRWFGGVNDSAAFTAALR
jgi:hypothetical protein